MLEKTCRCGKTKKNFAVDIGPFFIAECCEQAGYDHKGNRLEAEDVGLTKSEVEEALDVKEELQIVDEGEQPDPNEEGEIVAHTRVVADFDGNVLSEKKATDEELKQLNSKNKNRRGKKNQ